MCNIELETLCQIGRSSMKPAFGSPQEIDKRLAAAESAKVIKLTPISKNLGVEVEGVDLKQKQYRH